MTTHAINWPEAFVLAAFFAMLAVMYCACVSKDKR